MQRVLMMLMALCAGAQAALLEATFENGMAPFKRGWGRPDVDTDVARSGNASLRLVGGGQAESPPIPVETATYRISGWMKTDAVVAGDANYKKACVSLFFLDAEGKSVTYGRGAHKAFAYTDGTTDWTPFEYLLSITPDAPVRFVRVGLQNWNIASGTSWFDDVRVEKAGGGDLHKALMIQRGVNLPDTAHVVAAEEAAMSGTAQPAAKDDAYGSTALLQKPGDALTVELKLAPGAYTVRVRSACATADAFNEILPSWNGHPLRPHAVTNPFFTWQRSPFHHAEGDGGNLRIELVEGESVWIDDIVIQPFAADHEIAALRDYAETTVLAQNGQPRVVIALDDQGEFRAEAQRLATALGAAIGSRPEIVSPPEISRETFQQKHVIALGGNRTNMAVLSSMPHPWFRVPAPPETGPQVFIAVEPYGNGHNLVTLGGTSTAQISASIDAFLERLRDGAAPSLPFCQVPPCERAQPSDRETYRERAIASGTWLRQGNIRHLYHQWKHAAHDVFRLLSYRVMEYRESPETIKRAAYDGAIDMEHYKILAYFDQAEHHGVLSELERLDILNLLLKQAHYIEGRFEVECGPSRNRHADAVMDQHLEQRRENPRIAHNHQTFTVRSVLTAGHYFTRHYALEVAHKWIDWADRFMTSGPLQTSKPQCDCYGYQNITMIQAARHASDMGRWDYFDGEPLNRFLRLLLAQYDNLGSGVGHGDVKNYQPPHGADFRDKVVETWEQQCAGRYSFPQAQIEDVLGLYMHPLEPLWYAFNAQEDEPVALEQTFDKITFRDSVDPQKPYLILDGLSMGYHGHWDGNSILRFTDKGRMWLCEGSYIKTDPKEHNTLTIMRNGVSERPGKFSAVRHRFLSPDWGITVSRTPNYADADWDRTIVWHRPTGTFLVADSAQAHSQGAYDLTAYFRSLGDTALDERVWRVEQDGGERFYMHIPGSGSLSTAAAADDADTWKTYPFSNDPVPKILRHRRLVELEPGDTATLFTAFYAAGSAAAPRLAVHALGDSAIAYRGGPDGLFGRGDYRHHGIDAQGDFFVLATDSLSLLGGRRLTVQGHGFEADKPLNVAINLAQGSVEIQTQEPTNVVLTGIGTPAAVDMRQGKGTPQVRAGNTLSLPRGTVRFSVTPTALSTALEPALAAAWNEAAAQGTVAAAPPAPTTGMQPRPPVDLPSNILCLAVGQIDGEPGDDVAVGCADGLVAAFDAHGNELWRRNLPAKINDIAVADLDADGRAEVICGVEDSHLYVFAHDGSERLKRFFEAYRSSGGIEGHVRCVLVDDITGDGVPEIAAGCANTYYYVMDREGNTLDTDGQAWQYGFRHKALSIHAADLTGDGVKELLFSHTYNNRFMADFTDTSHARVQGIGGTKAGCRAITTADADGDGLPEAIFGDMDGQVTAAKRRTDRGRGPGVIVWQNMIGTDEISAIHGGDFTGDGADEILLASHSGFLAMLDARGAVTWIRYAENQVTDAHVLPGAKTRFVRASTDGSVAVYDAAGQEQARWQVGAPVTRLALSTGQTTPRVYAAAGTRLIAADLE